MVNKMPTSLLKLSCYDRNVTIYTKSEEGEKIPLSQMDRGIFIDITLNMVILVENSYRISSNYIYHYIPFSNIDRIDISGYFSWEPCNLPME